MKTMKRILFMFVVVLVLGGLILSGCTPAPAPTPAPTPPPTPDWTPPIPGMEKGDEDIYITATFGLPMPREKPPEGFDLTFHEYMFNYMTEKTGGRFKIDDISKTTMGKMKEMPELIGGGMVDIAMTPVGGYLADIFPLSAIALMPGWGISDDGAKNEKLWRYGWQHPLTEAEFAKKNFRNIAAAPGNPMHVMLAKGAKEVNKVDDFKGMNIRGFGYQSIWAETLGMKTSDMYAQDAYEGLQKGIIDASDFSIPGIFYKKVYEVCDRVIEPSYRVGGGGGVPQFMNLDKWNEQPKYMQDLWTEAADAAAIYGAKLAAVAVEAGKKAGAANGMTWVKFSPEEGQKMMMAIGPAWDKWVADVEGKKGGEKIREYLKDQIAFRDKLTGEPWMIFKP
jgi:TRAP-type C4-dicarboxylate transport system substrate-binding protein